MSFKPNTHEEAMQLLGVQDILSVSHEEKEVTPEERHFFIMPFHIANDHSLSIPERFLLSMINSLDKEDNCYATNRYFADILGVSIRYISEMIATLKNKKKLAIVGRYKNRRIIKSLSHHGKKY